MPERLSRYSVSGKVGAGCLSRASGSLQTTTTPIKDDDDSRRAGLQSVATASDPLRPAGRGPYHDVEKPNAAHWQAKEESEREIPAKVNAPRQPQSSGAQVG